MQITDEIIAAAARAMYERHLETGALERDEVAISPEQKTWWLKELEDDARVALAAALESQP